MRNQLLVLTILIVSPFFSCKHEVKNTIQTEKNLIEISIEQFRSENMVLGRVSKTELKEKVAFTGAIVPKINGLAKISVPVPGKITSILIQNGQYVKANETILRIGGSELIDLQQKFATSSAKIKQLKSNYDKAKLLYDENIKTENEYLLSESNYMVEIANYSALKVKLLNIGLNLTNIKNGSYVSEYSLQAPISGQISAINILRGQYVTSENEIVEIIDNNKTELHLTLFEKDFTKIRIGQKVQFWNVDKNMSESIAIINRIGGVLNSNSNTFVCFASVSGKTDSYAINQMVTGEVIISTDSVQAIPQSAVFTIGINHYVLHKISVDDNKYTFAKKKISIGKSSDNYNEILDGIEDEEILISGTYNINIE